MLTNTTHALEHTRTHSLTHGDREKVAAEHTHTHTHTCTSIHSDVRKCGKRQKVESI